MTRSARLARIVFGAVLSIAVFGLSLSVPAANAAPPEQTAPATAPPSSGQVWVQNHLPTDLWSGPDASAVRFGPLRKFSFLRVERDLGKRLYVFNPRTENFAYVDVSAVGPSGAPPADYLTATQVVQQLNVPARLVGSANFYAEPVSDDSVWLRSGSHNFPVVVEAQVKGDGSPWYRLDTGEYVSGDQIRLPGTPTARFSGKWIDANLTDPTVVTAYEGDRPVASTLAIRGVSAWQTPVGTYHIWRRVANETMSSDGLGIPRNAPGGYYVENVLFTQYFSPDGAALHYNYWSSMWGYPGSHGCLGMNYDDAAWFWNWAEVGTPVVVHY
jgi:lipoprotein-anchoring transpeptidase ErfK/SrfK